MSEHKHTPGPWESYYDPSVPGYFVVSRVDADSETFVAKVNNPGTNYRVELGNAIIIKAAPALLEALEAVEWVRDGFYDVMYCPCCGNARSQGHTGDCKLGNALKQARGER